MRPPGALQGLIPVEHRAGTRLIALPQVESLATTAAADQPCAVSPDQELRAAIGAGDCVPANRLFGLCLDHGKTLVSVSESIDLSNWVGPDGRQRDCRVAEGELEAIGERTRGSQRKIQELGCWHGRNVPYGYRAVQRDGGWYLDINPDTVKVAREIVRRAADRESIRSIADDRPARGIPAPRGAVGRLRRLPGCFDPVGSSTTRDASAEGWVRDPWNG